MRPIKLTVEGFTSFADRVEVDFSQLDLFAITGPTGSGKTSLLDAITWALYGRTSRLNKTSTDLISHSAERVSVHLEFSVGTNRYRVARTCKRTGSPRIQLEKYSGEWIAVETGGAAETNETIGKIIGLDFDAFTRSVILPQGKFDAFLRGEHKGRREILKKLLGLEIYDRMQELAAGKRDQFAAERAAKQGVIEREYATANDETLSAHQASLAQANRLSEENANHWSRSEQLLNIGKELRRNRESLAKETGNRSRTETFYLDAVGALTDKTTEALRLTHQSSAIEEALGVIAIDETRYKQLVALNERAKTLAALEDDHKNVVKSLATERPELAQVQHDAALAKTEECRTDDLRVAADARLKAGREALKQIVAQGSHDHLNGLLEALHQLPEKRKSVKQLESQLEKAKASNQDLAQQLQDGQAALKAKEDALSRLKQEQEHLTIQNSHRELKAGLQAGAACPICEQIVQSLPTVPGKSALDSIKKQVKKLETEFNDLSASIAKAASQLESLPARLVELDARLTTERAGINRSEERIHKITGELPDEEMIAALNSKLAEISAAEKQVKNLEVAFEKANGLARSASEKSRLLEKQAEGLVAHLTSQEKMAGKLAADILSLRPDIDSAGGAAAISSALAVMDKAKKERDKLQVDLKMVSDALHEAQAAKANAESKVAVQQERMRAATEAITGCQNEIANLLQSWSKDASGFPLEQGKDEAEQVEKRRVDLERDRVQISGDITRLTMAIEDTQGKIARLAELKNELDDVRAQHDIYAQLTNALRANHFVSYLLEAAYADLCEKGSTHLLRLSGERYSFTAGENEFCVKDSWNGDAERSASTLSGGESFLASLSLALALGDSVASVGAGGQPGTRLEALFLDEGVSTLDQDETLPGVVEALTQLQTGDRMVGVISHMENLAERMPARIAVVKKHGRSSIDVQASHTLVHGSAGQSR